MNNNKLSVLFLIDRTKQNKQNKCPIKCRLTFKGKRKQFSTGFFINPKDWKSKLQKGSPPNKNNNYINTQLSLIKQQINQAFLFLQVNNEQFDAEDIYLQLKGITRKKDKTILEVFQAHNDKVEKLIGKEYVLPTLWKYKQAKALLKDFISFHYKKNDFQFKDLEISFIKEYEFYLKTEKKLAQSSTYKAIQRFKRIVKIGLSEGYLDKDPFVMYTCKNPKTQIVYLDSNELAKLEEHSFAQTRLKQVRDMFIFCCYTGLAYAEMSALSSEHVIDGFDGNKWIKIHRKKTNVKVSVPLLPKALAILTSQNNISSNKLLPVISNQKFNSFLKEIAEIVGIEKRLTHHIARKTFATTVLLYNDVPMEVVSELLGHSKLDITQKHYAKVVQKKVSEHITLLARKLDK
ncbi:site-specific integrase [uncultured Kordia sp.]|uniref:site-specific integrase n=1 Tax=uncultured Kordia sp. TaxID=507699 RepID=UPI0026347CA9|nr:site-specific integrase [uncultured Kordia sp.]